MAASTDRPLKAKAAAKLDMSKVSITDLAWSGGVPDEAEG